jgi:hypothetical protein
MDNTSDYMESHFIIHESQAYEYDVSEWYIKVYVVESILMTTMKTLLFVSVYDLAIYMGIS